MVAPPIRPLSRVIALVAAVALVVLPATAATAATAAPAVPAAEAAPAAAGWLASLLKDGRYLEREKVVPVDPADPFGPTTTVPVPDPGLTIDAMLAFAAAGVGGDRIATMAAWLTQPDVLTAYVMPGFAEGWGAPGYNAGETAKVVLALQAAGLPAVVHDAAGNDVDLVAELRDLMQPGGLLQNADPAVGDDTNAFDEALGVLALANTAVGAPAAATAFLADTRCAGKGFPLFFGAPPASCKPSVDATAMVAQALLAAGTHAADSAAGIAWMVSLQDPVTGGFPDVDLADPTTAGLNSNSAGLAGEALRAFGQTAPADRAVAYLASLQVGCDGAPADRGAVAYNAQSPNDPDNTGFSRGTAPRATAQAVLGLAGVALGDLDTTHPAPGVTRLDCAPPPVLAVTGTPTARLALAGAASLVLGITILIGLRLRRRTR